MKIHLKFLELNPTKNMKTKKFIYDFAKFVFFSRVSNSIWLLLLVVEWQQKWFYGFSKRQTTQRIWFEFYVRLASGLERAFDMWTITSHYTSMVNFLLFRYRFNTYEHKNLYIFFVSSSKIYILYAFGACLTYILWVILLVFSFVYIFFRFLLSLIWFRIRDFWSYNKPLSFAHTSSEQNHKKYNIFFCGFPCAVYMWYSLC